MILAQRRSQAILDRCLHQLLDSPETSRQKKDDRDENREGKRVFGNASVTSFATQAFATQARRSVCGLDLVPVFIEGNQELDPFFPPRRNLTC